MNVVQADPTSLQGGNPYLQGAGSPMNVYNPQQTAPVQAPVQTAQPVSQPVAQPQPSYSAPKPTAQSIQLNPIFNSAIGTRASASNPGVLEYYNKQTGQGFSNPNDLFAFASQLGAGPVSSFDQLTAPVNQNLTETTSITPYQDPNQAIAQGAGNAGLSVDDLTKLAQANGAITPDQLQSIYNQLGITPDLINSTYAAPAQSTVDLYNQAYNTAGLGDLHQQLLDISDQIKQAQDDATNAVGTVNENPFLDEADRVGRVSRLNDKAQSLIGNLQTQQTNLNNLYTQGVAEANAFVTRNTDEFNLEKTQAAAKLNSLIQLAQAQETAQEASNAQQVYRYLPDYLSNKTASNAPIGDATSGFYKYNPDTKSYEQIAGPANQFTSNPITGDLYNQATGQLATSSDYSAAFGAPPPQTGAAANLPQRNNNPGDLKGANGQFAVYSTPQQGWNALVSDLTGKMTGNTSTGLNANSTLAQLISVWAPSSDGNSPASYAADVAKQLGVTTDTKIGTLDPQQLAVAIANHEGYFAGSSSSSNSLASQATVSNYTEYTASGQPYINQDKIPSNLNTMITTEANTAGVPILNQDEVSKLQAIDVSNQNLDKIASVVSNFLPSNAADRLTQGPLNELASAFQSNNDISAFNSWRTAIINNVQALAGGSGSGLRINQAEIDSAMSNDLPTITDTIGVAQTKIANLKSQLQAWQQEYVGGSNSGSSLSGINFAAN